MLVTTKVKMSGSEKKVNTNIYDISSINRVVNRKFLEVSRCSRANNGKEIYKKVCGTYNVVYLPIRRVRPTKCLVVFVAVAA